MKMDLKILKGSMLLLPLEAGCLTFSLACGEEQKHFSLTGM
jgi:hypothetical protein